VIKKIQKHGVFFGAENHDVKTPYPPRIPPRSHHQNTTPKHPLFPKHPSKTQQNNRNPVSHHARNFFRKSAIFPEEP
jgi:hypothetical protein